MSSQPLTLDAAQVADAFMIAARQKVSAARDLYVCLERNRDDISVCGPALDACIEHDQDFDTMLTLQNACAAASAHVNHDPAIDVMDRVRSLALTVPVDHAERIEAMFLQVRNLMHLTAHNTAENRMKAGRGWALAVAFARFRQALEMIP